VAQQQTCTSVSLGNGVFSTTCNPTPPPITHRRPAFDTSAADQAYQQRAYEFELRQLERENRR